MSSASAIAGSLRSESWAGGAPRSGGDPCASIPGFAGMALQYIQPLNTWFNDLLGDPSAVAGFAHGWQNVEAQARGVAGKLSGEKARLADLDGRSIRKLRERYDDLEPIVTDTAEWSGAAAAALKLASTIVTAVRQFVCDFLVQLRRYWDELFEWSWNPLDKVDDLWKFADAAFDLVQAGGRLIETMFTALEQLGTLLNKLQPLVMEALDEMRRLLAWMYKTTIPLIGGSISDMLQDDPDVEELDPGILDSEGQQAYNDLMDRGEINGLTDLLDQNGLIDKISGGDSTAISVQTIRRPDGSEYTLVNLPSTLDWAGLDVAKWMEGGPINDWDANVAQVLFDNPVLRTQYERAVMDAMRDAGVPPGSDVVWSGFSQGGIMAGNMGSDSSAHGYNTVGIVTNGSPIDHFPIPNNIPVLQVQHALDPVPLLDGQQIPNLGPNVDWVMGNPITAPDGGFGPHNAGTYSDTLKDYVAGGGQFRNDWSFLNGDVVDTYLGHTGEGNYRTQPTTN